MWVWGSGVQLSLQLGGSSFCESIEDAAAPFSLLVSGMSHRQWGVWASLALGVRLLGCTSLGHLQQTNSLLSQGVSI